MNTDLSESFPLTNRGICRLFATLSCAALMLLLPTELLLRTAHLKSFAFSLLPLLGLNIIILVVGDLFVSLAEYARHKHRELDRLLFGGSRHVDPTFREHLASELIKYYKMAVKCEDWGVEALEVGLIFTVIVVIALAILILF
jgi:hypothetical protein